MNLAIFRILLFLFGLIIIGEAQASCGLHSCPRGQAPATSAFEGGLSLNQSGFDLHGHGGQYSSVTPHFQYTYMGKMILAGNVPVAGLTVANETKWGFRNPLLLGEWRFFPGMGNQISIGTQLELPFGDHDNGLAAEHVMILPYLGYHKEIASYFMSATLGLSTTVEHEHEEDTSVVKPFIYVGPHEDRELLYRTSAGISVMDNKANLEVFVSGQHVLVEEKEAVENEDDLSAGAVFPIKIGKSFAVEPHVEFPLIMPGRFDWSTGMDFRFIY